MISQWKRQATGLLGSQAVSMLGSSVVQFALIWHITLVTGSGTAVALSTAAAALPLLFFSPLAGVWADRYNRRVIVVAADALVALATLGIFFAFLLGHDSLPLMYAVLFVRGTGAAFQSPAVSALVPSFVPEKHLARINGINGSMQALSNVLGPALGGMVLSFWPIHWVLLIDVTTALIGITVFWVTVTVPAYAQTDAEPGAWHTEFVSGVRYIRNHEFFLPLLVLLGVAICAISAPSFLANLHVIREFGADTWRLSVVETAYGIGAILGGSAVAVWAGARREATTVAWAIAAMGLSCIGLALSPTFPLFVVAMFALGLVIPYINAPALTLFQRTCDPRHTGKVMSVFIMMTGALLPLGVLVFGPMSDHISVRTIMILGGIVELAVCAAFLLHPRIRAIPVPAETP